jgi:hypothetical protein
MVLVQALRVHCTTVRGTCTRPKHRYLVALSTRHGCDSRVASREAPRASKNSAGNRVPVHGTSKIPRSRFPSLVSSVQCSVFASVQCCELRVESLRNFQERWVLSSEVLRFETWTRARCTHACYSSTRLLVVQYCATGQGPC